MDDPVAEFLAREDGALDDDIDVGQQAAPAPQENGLPVQNGIHRGDGGDSGVDLAAQDIPDVIAPLSNGHSNSARSTPSNISVTREEHETIKRWREEHAKLLKEKDDAEVKQKETMLKSAKAELKEWKEKRKTEIADRKKKKPRD